MASVFDRVLADAVLVGGLDPSVLVHAGPVGSWPSPWMSLAASAVVLPASVRRELIDCGDPSALATLACRGDLTSSDLRRLRECAQIWAGELMMVPHPGLQEAVFASGLSPAAVRRFWEAPDPGGVSGVTLGALVASLGSDRGGARAFSFVQDRFDDGSLTPVSLGDLLVAAAMDCPAGRFGQAAAVFGSVTAGVFAAGLLGPLADVLSSDEFCTAAVGLLEAGFGSEELVTEAWRRSERGTSADARTMTEFGRALVGEFLWWEEWVEALGAAEEGVAPSDVAVRRLNTYAQSGCSGAAGRCYLGPVVRNSAVAYRDWCFAVDMALNHGSPSPGIPASDVAVAIGAEFFRQGRGVGFVGRPASDRLVSGGLTWLLSAVHGGSVRRDLLLALVASSRPFSMLSLPAGFPCSDLVDVAWDRVPLGELLSGARAGVPVEVMSRLVNAVGVSQVGLLRATVASAAAETPAQLVELIAALT